MEKQGEAGSDAVDTLKYREDMEKGKRAGNPEWNILRYDPTMKGEWDRLVGEARNGTFLFNRDYMDYHSDRFADHSLLACRGGDPVALLPADITSDRVLHSHRGLTYGGWIVPDRHFDGNDMMALFDATAQYCLEKGISELDYKPLPWIYARRPAQDDLYALFRHGAVRTSCMLSATVAREPGARLNTLQRRHLRKALASGVEVEETGDVSAFHGMLAECLKERHDTQPVHTAEELEMLRDRFPENIKFFVSRLRGGSHAGVCVYDTGTVAHCQYIATTNEGRRHNLLTPLIQQIMTGYLCHCRYFDFGTSNEYGGQVLNGGLLRQKSSYGATGVVYERYSIYYSEKEAEENETSIS